MKSKWLAVIVCAVAVTAACEKKADEEVTTDSTTVQGMDTVDMPTGVPTTDTIVTTTTTEVDTLHGEAKDTTKQ